MKLYSTWFDEVRTVDKKKSLTLFKERTGQRPKVTASFKTTVQSHYDDLKNLSADIKDLGFPLAAKIFKNRVPQTAKARSGELGEIFASEYIEECLGFNVPIKRLRYKDGREMALRGDDIIGIKIDSSGGFTLLKAESKSRASLTSTVLKEARQALNNNNGRCTPTSLLFIADQLILKGGKFKTLGNAIKKEVGLKNLKPSQIDHTIFTFSGNDAQNILSKNLISSDLKRNQHVGNIYFPDHQKFIKNIYDNII